MESTNKSRLTTVTRVVILTAFYFVGGLVGKDASFLSGSVALVWPPCGDRPGGDFALREPVLAWRRFGGGPVFLYERRAVGVFHAGHGYRQHHGGRRLRISAEEAHRF